MLTLYFYFAGGAFIIKLGDKEIEYNEQFRFYITTKLSNPHYTPEISTKAIIVNFAVKEQGESFLYIIMETCNIYIYLNENVNCSGMT